jgi:hypothetical protein
VPLASAWNSLEVAKLVVAVLTPILLLVLGLLVGRASRRLEDQQWSKRRLIERRIEIYDRMAPWLNDLYCFFMLVGHFVDIDPPTAIDRKRDLDKTFFVNRYLFESKFADRYFAFIDACFKDFAEVAKSAELRARVEPQKRERGSTWKDEWTEFFAPPEDATSTDVIAARYEELMNVFSSEIGVSGASPLSQASG